MDPASLYLRLTKLSGGQLSKEILSSSQRWVNIEFSVSSSPHRVPRFLAKTSENSATLSDSSCPLVENSETSAENSAILTNLRGPFGGGVPGARSGNGKWGRSAKRQCQNSVERGAPIKTAMSGARSASEGKMGWSAER